MKSHKGEAGTRLLAEIDAQVRESEQLSMAVKVERLLESAAPAFTGAEWRDVFTSLVPEFQRENPEWRWRSTTSDEHDCFDTDGDGDLVQIDHCDLPDSSDLWLHSSHWAETSCFSALANADNGSEFNRQAAEYQLSRGIHVPMRTHWGHAGQCPCQEPDCPWLLAVSEQIQAQLVVAEPSSPTCSCGCGAQGGDGP